MLLTNYRKGAHSQKHAMRHFVPTVVEEARQERGKAPPLTSESIPKENDGPRTQSRAVFVLKNVRGRQYCRNVRGPHSSGNVWGSHTTEMYVGSVLAGKSNTRAFSMSPRRASPQRSRVEEGHMYLKRLLQQQSILLRYTFGGREKRVSSKRAYTERKEGHSLSVGTSPFAVQSPDHREPA